MNHQPKKLVQSKILTVLFFFFFLILNTRTFGQTGNTIKLLTTTTGSSVEQSISLIISYLENELNLKVERTSAPSVKQLLSELETGQFDLIFTSPFFYSLVKTRDIEINPLIAFGDANGDPIVYYSCFVVNRSSGFNTFQDLLDQRENVDLKFAYSTSTSGHMIPRLHLALQGVTLPEMYFNTVGFSAGHDAVREEVSKNEIDLGSCACDEGTFDGTDLRPIWSSDPILTSFFSYTNHLNEDTKLKLETAFLEFQDRAAPSKYSQIVASHPSDDFTGFIELSEKPLENMTSSMGQIKDLVFFISYYQDRIKEQQQAIAEGEKVLEEQQKEIEEKLSLIENQSTLLYASIGGIIVTLLAVFFSYRNLRQRKKLSIEQMSRAKIMKAQNLELENQKAQLADQNHQVDKVIKETEKLVLKAIEEGDLNSRINEAEHEGQLREFAKYINAFIDSVVKPFEQVSRIFKGMSTGDLSLRYEEEARGDIKELATNVNDSLDSLNDLLLSIESKVQEAQRSSEEVSTTGEEAKQTMQAISVSISEISQGAHSQLSKVDDASHKVEVLNELSASIKTQSVSVNELASKGNDQSEAGTELNRNVVTKMDLISTLSKEMHESTNALNKSMYDVQQILSLMKEIVEQTSLLSLNASIEAANAGESGLGFTVIADEIRKLADRSKHSVTEVEDIVASLQKRSGLTKDKVEEVMKQLGEGMEVVQKAGQGFISTKDFFEKTLGESQEIREATEKQFGIVKEVIDRISQVVVVSEETAAATEQVATSSTELTSALEKYHEKTLGFEKMAASIADEVRRFELKKSQDLFSESI